MPGSQGVKTEVGESPTLYRNCNLRLVSSPQQSGSLPQGQTITFSDKEGAIEKL
jgi:hypothetical protein